MFDGVGRRQEQATGSFLDIGQHSLNGRERNCLFRNNGDGTFTDVGWVDDADRVEDARGLAVVDYDRDGQLDLVLRNYRQPAVVLRNRGGAAHWIDLRLVGTRSNRDAVGAKVRVRTGERWQLREVHAGSAYLSSQSLIQHVGLGAATRADEVVVEWPSGVRSSLRSVPADRRYTVVEGNEGSIPPALTMADGDRPR